ncbi:MAG: glycoside hydrolase family 43 protein [Phycisphaerae bacterium]
MFSRNLFNLLALALFFSFAVIAKGASEITPRPAALHGRWGDQGDGTFVNPLLPADYSDLDVIRVNGVFYAISSTFQYSPGVVILRSRDLVNWAVAGHAVDDLTRISPELNWNRMNHYGRGIWAGAIRHHNGKFWIYFGTPDEGFFMTTAADAAGPWLPPTPVMKAKGWDDCCPFWDDDGQGYFICSHFADAYKIHLFKMSDDGRSLLPESDRVLYHAHGSEANKLLKINGTYFHLFSEVKPEGRVIMAERAQSLEGPWQVRQLNHVNRALDKEPNQGGLVQVDDGRWWYLTHQGTGDWEGRDMVLLPVSWIDGWPVIGKPGADLIGNMVWSSKMPGIAPADHSFKTPTRFDENFDNATLAPQWEWNYQPRAEKWSLTERPGFLRLHAFKPLATGDLLKAGNTLTQRIMRAGTSAFTLKIDVAGMTDGQEAGLCHLAKAWATLGVSQAGAVRTLIMKTARKTIEGPQLSGNNLWLRSTWDDTGASQFSFSLDGASFTNLGPPVPLTWSYYRGDRIGIYCYNNASDTGYIDVDTATNTCGPH